MKEEDKLFILDSMWFIPVIFLIWQTFPYATPVYFIGGLFFVVGFVLRQLEEPKMMIKLEITRSRSSSTRRRRR